MSKLPSAVWRALAYAPRFVRHAWHRRRRGIVRAFSGAQVRMREY
jgi:hypothetical protein